MFAKKEVRMGFIPELRDHITANLTQQGVALPIIEESFRKWHEGLDPVTPWEHGCFEVFRTVQAQVEAQGD